MSERVDKEKVPERRRTKDAEWERRKPRLHRMWFGERRSREEILRAMAEDDFHITLKQLRHRFEKKWKWQRNDRSHTTQVQRSLAGQHPDSEALTTNHHDHSLLDELPNIPLSFHDNTGPVDGSLDLVTNESTLQESWARSVDCLSTSYIDVTDTIVSLNSGSRGSVQGDMTLCLNGLETAANALRPNNIPQQMQPSLDLDHEGAFDPVPSQLWQLPSRSNSVHLIKSPGRSQNTFTYHNPSTSRTTPYHMVSCQNEANEVLFFGKEIEKAIPLLQELLTKKANVYAVDDSGLGALHSIIVQRIEIQPPSYLRSNTRAERQCERCGGRIATEEHHAQESVSERGIDVFRTFELHPESFVLLMKYIIHSLTALPCVTSKRVRKKFNNVVLEDGYLRQIYIKLRLLLQNGCDPNLLDNEGLSPSDYARGCSSWPYWERALNETGWVYVHDSKLCKRVIHQVEEIFEVADPETVLDNPSVAGADFDAEFLDAFDSNSTPTMHGVHDTFEPGEGDMLDDFQC